MVNSTNLIVYCSDLSCYNGKSIQSMLVLLPAVLRKMAVVVIYDQHLSSLISTAERRCSRFYFTAYTHKKVSGAVFDHWCTFHRVPRAPPACRLPSCWCRATRVKFTAASSTPTEPRLPPPDSTDSYVSYNQLTLAQSCSLHIPVKTFILLNTFLKACFFSCSDVECLRRMWKFCHVEGPQWSCDGAALQHRRQVWTWKTRKPI